MVPAAMTLLPFQSGDIVRWCDGQAAKVLEIRGDRIAIEVEDGTLHITTDVSLRAMQAAARRGAA